MTESDVDRPTFLGLASYCRLFVCNFVDLDGPLYRLTEKDLRFMRSGDCERAFQPKTGKLTSPLTFIVQDTSPSVPLFILDVDTSEKATGVILSHQSPNDEVVTPYKSRSLS